MKKFIDAIESIIEILMDSPDIPINIRRKLLTYYYNQTCTVIDDARIVRSDEGVSVKPTGKCLPNGKKSLRLDTLRSGNRWWMKLTPKERAFFTNQMKVRVFWVQGIKTEVEIVFMEPIE